MRSDRSRPRLVVIVLLASLLALLVACPRQEALQRFDLTMPDSVSAGEPFALTVTAIGNMGSDPLTSFNGTVTLESSVGTVSPTSLALVDGVGQTNATITDAVGDVTVTASDGGQTGDGTITVFGDALPGEADDPVEEAIPRFEFVPLEEDYTEDHPELANVALSFNALVLVFELDTTVEEANLLLMDIDAEIVGGIPGFEGQEPGILFLRVPTQTHQEMIDLLADLRANPLVRHVVQDGLLETTLIPQPNGGTPAGWTWQSTPAGGNWGMELIRAPQMWNLNAAVEKSGNTTLTGVLDVGFANNHEDLVFNQNQTFGTQADHGTHVAGTIAATFDNGIGVDGVNPFAELVVNAPTFSGTAATTFDLRASWGQQMSAGFFDLINNSDVVVVNASLGYNWGSAGINQNTNATAQDIVEEQAAIFGLAQIINLIIGNDLPLFVVSAGNDSNDIVAPGGGFVVMDAKWGSPFTYAGLEFDLPNIIVVESVQNNLGAAGGASRSGFSNINADISAPGSDVLSTSWRAADPTDLYETFSGTSMSAPHVTGLVSYLLSVDPTLLHSEIVTLLTDNSVAVAGGASNRIDAFATVMDIDDVQGNDNVLTMLLDIDDGSPDGNQRTYSDGTDFTGEDADGDGGIGDGNIDMSDFRRWRDWLLQVENNAALSLDGSSSHPKKDVNGNGSVQSASNENIYPRGDFNGDGQLSRTATSFVPGAVNATVTDLGVLQQLFSDSNYTAAELPNLVSSADLEIWPDTCLGLAGVASVESFIRVSGTTTVLETRTHTLAAGPRQVLTAAVDPAGYTARVEAKDAGGTTLFSDEQVFPFTLGSDALWDPNCTTEGDGEGGSWGDPHLVTFDGLKYDFQSVGEFILVESASDDLIVQVRQQPWGGSDRVSVNTAVATNLNDQEVGLYAGETPPLRVDGIPNTVADGGSLTLGSSRVDRSGNVYTLVWPSGETVAATVTSSYLNVNLNLLASRGGAIAGLLGQFDGTTANDIALRTGTVLTQPIAFGELYGVYADSWRISDAESRFHYETGENTSTFTDPSFPSALATTGDLDPDDRDAAEKVCLEAGVTDLIILDACILDVGVTGESGFADDAAAITPPVDELELELPDLVVTITGPTSASPGDEIAALVGLTAENIGVVDAFGTLSAGSNGYMIDVVLSTDQVVPVGFAVYSPNFSEDVLLQGGRVSNTLDLVPGGSESYSIVTGTIPADTPAGSYFLCSQIDPGTAVAELNESNNVDCVAIEIMEAPFFDITSYAFSPKSPAELPFSPEGAPCPTEGTVFITGTYEKSVADPVLIFARPLTGGSLTPKYGASGSPEYTALTGTFEQSFCLRDDVTLERRVDQIRFHFERPRPSSEILYEEFADVDFLFVRPQPQEVCIDFEDPPFVLRTQYGDPVGDLPGNVVFTEQGIVVTVENFTQGAFTGFNYAQIDDQAGLSGKQNVWLNNIDLEFNFARLGFTPTSVTFEFLDFGGSENIAVNGSATTEGELKSGVYGGISTTIVRTPSPTGGSDYGTGILSGNVQSLKLGGQEFWLDTVCASNQNGGEE